MSQVVAVTGDLIFQTKLTSTAQAVGVELVTVPGALALENQLTHSPARLVLVDMGLQGDEAAAAIRTAAEQSERPKIIAYYSHVETKLAELAKEAGADKVMARSAFSADLPAILKSAL